MFGYSYWTLNTTFKLVIGSSVCVFDAEVLSILAEENKYNIAMDVCQKGGT